MQLQTCKKSIKHSLRGTLRGGDLKRLCIPAIVYNITEVFPCETCGFIVKFKYLLGKCGADLLQAEKGWICKLF